MTVLEIINVCRMTLIRWRDAGEPEAVNKRTLAELVGVSERTLTDWQQRGMPVAHSAERGASNDYAPLDVLAWLHIRASDIARESAKDRLDRLRGDQLEREMLKEDGVLVMPEDLEVEYEAMVDAARAELLFNMPDAMAAELSTVLGIEVDVSIIRRHVEDSLQTLSHYDPSDEPDNSAADDAAEAEAEREGVDP